MEQLLGRLRASTDGSTAELVEDLVAAMLDLYGAALRRILGEVDDATRLTLAADELVGSLLLVHELHPLDIDARIQQALDRVRPYLGSHAGGVSYLGVDDAGVAHLVFEGACQSCPSSAVTAQQTLQRAVFDAAPEVASVDVRTGAAQPKLLQIGPPPDRDGCPATPAPRGVPVPQ